MDWIVDPGCDGAGSIAKRTEQSERIRDFTCMYLLCSYSLGVVSFELRAHSDPFLPPVHAGKHGSTRFVEELSFLQEGPGRTFDTCNALFLSSSSASPVHQAEDRNKLYISGGY